MRAVIRLSAPNPSFRPPSIAIWAKHNGQTQPFVCGRRDASQASRWLLSGAQIAGRIALPDLQILECVADVSRLETGRVGATDACVDDVEVAACPSWSGPLNGDAIVQSVREFDQLIFAIAGKVVPMGTTPRYLVHVLKIFLIVSRITTNITELRFLIADGCQLVGIKNDCIRFDRQVAD